MVLHQFHHRVLFARKHLMGWEAASRYKEFQFFHQKQNQLKYELSGLRLFCSAHLIVGAKLHLSLLLIPGFFHTRQHQSKLHN